MNKYVVTGGAGFIGSHLVEELLYKGKYVTVIDNFLTGKEENLNFVKSLPENTRKNYTLISGDIRNLGTVHATVKNADYILHHAALASVPDSCLAPDLTNDININGMLNVLIAAKEANVKKVVFASSSAVYDDSYELPQLEGENINLTSSPYALTKKTGEEYCRLFSKLYGLDTVCLRYFNVYGPRQDPSSEYAAVIPKFITAILNNERPVIYGDGQQTRDFVFVNDVVRANILSCEMKTSGGDIFNIGGGNKISINSLLECIQKILKSEITPQYADKRPGDAMNSLANIEKAKEILRFNPTVSLKEGLAKTIDYFKIKQMSNESNKFFVETSKVE